MEHEILPSGCVHALPGRLRVKLAAIKRGRKFLTTEAAVREFFSSLPSSGSASAPPAPRTPAKRQRESDRAKKKLRERYGI